jgi:hypothetical protein
VSYGQDDEAGLQGSHYREICVQVGYQWDMDPEGVWQRIMETKAAQRFKDSTSAVAGLERGGLEGSKTVPPWRSAVDLVRHVP